MGKSAAQALSGPGVLALKTSHGSELRQIHPLAEYKHNSITWLFSTLLVVSGWGRGVKMESPQSTKWLNISY